MADEPERCESGDPACGPAVYEDEDGVRLCADCWNALEPETSTQRRARHGGLAVIEGGSGHG